MKDMDLKSGDIWGEEMEEAMHAEAKEMKLEKVE
jgi:hypothetical protein